jgi:triphosphoribosyl-dephospho-CoA synthase
VHRELVRSAYLAACRAELEALKPGNVHVFADGHGMTAADFELSASASVEAIARPRLALGSRIYDAVRRSKAATGCNTNLGIVLLCAPLAQASFHHQSGSLRERLRDVLARLTRRDAEHVFRAISLANPGGLGESRKHDVHRPARVTLRTAMLEARARDRIARQYVTDFADIFAFGLPRLREVRARWPDENWAVASLYLGYLGRFPDSHVRRKFGLALARELRGRAADLDGRLLLAKKPEALKAEMLRFDKELKALGYNPGTSADLTVATLFAAALERRTSRKSGSLLA